MEIAAGDSHHQALVIDAAVGAAAATVAPLDAARPCLNDIIAAGSANRSAWRRQEYAYGNTLRQVAWLKHNIESVAPLLHPPRQHLVAMPLNVGPQSFPVSP